MYFSVIGGGGGGPCGTGGIGGAITTGAAPRSAPATGRGAGGGAFGLN